MNVEFQIARADNDGYYSESELQQETNLLRLYENTVAQNQELQGRIKINFEVGPSIYMSDALPSLIRSMCSDAVRKLSAGREAIVNYCTRYGSILMQPLNNYVFISGAVNTDASNTEQADGSGEKAWVCPKQNLLEGLSTCRDRYQSFTRRLREVSAGNRPYA